MSDISELKRDDEERGKERERKRECESQQCRHAKIIFAIVIKIDYLKEYE